MRPTLIAFALVACRATAPPAPPAPQARRVLPSLTIGEQALPEPFPDVSPFRLPHTFEPTRYRVRIAVHEHQFVGHIEIEGELSEEVSLVWLHGVDLYATKATATHGSEVVVLEASRPRRDELLGLRSKTPLVPGPWTLAIDYSGPVRDEEPSIPSSYGGPPTEPPALGVFRRIVGDDAYVFTQSEPIYARRIFPCIDEPDRKVPWKLTLDVRRDLVAASNTPIVRETTIDRDLKRVEFAETAPLPSYLVAFAIGPFEIVDAGKAKNGTPIRILALHGHAATVAPSARIAVKTLDWLEAWLAIPYPYGKLDLVATPHTGWWWAMENPGLVTVKQEVLEGRGDGTTIAHELAHQWFGDLVTPAWWDDIWLNESFAAFMSDKVVASLVPDSVVDPVTERASALRVVGRGVRISRSVDSISQLDFRQFVPHEAIERGVALLQMVEMRLGSDPFRDALRAYLTGHANKNVKSADLIHALADVADKTTAPTLSRLLEEPLPALETKVSCEGRAHLHVSAVPWPIQVCVAYDRDGKRSDVCTVVDRSSLDIPLQGKGCPRWVLPGAGGAGLFRIDWTKPLIHDLLAKGWSSLSSDDKRELFGELDDDDAKLSVFLRLLEDGETRPLPGELPYLSSLIRYVPNDLRAHFDAWVEARYGARARDLHFQVPEGAGQRAAQHDVEMIDLVARTADPQLVNEALAIAKQYPNLHNDSWFAEPALALAAESSPEIRAKLFDDLKINDRDGVWRRYVALDALARVHGLVGLLKADPKLLAGVRKYDGIRLFSEVCDPGDRKDLAELFGEDAKTRFRGLLEMVDRCVAKRASLAPSLKKWLAKP